MRGLKFSLTGVENVQINNMNANNWETLGVFNTATAADNALQSGKRTLQLKAGLNKIVISEVAAQGNSNASNIGNLTFTLNNTSSRTNSS